MLSIIAESQIQSNISRTFDERKNVKSESNQTLNMANVLSKNGELEEVDFETNLSNPENQTGE